MKTTTAMFVTCVFVSMLLTASMALPPEFFRAGRRGFPVPIQKKSSAVAAASYDVMEAACAFCGTYSRSWELECRSTNSDNRQICVYAFLWAMENKDWQNQVEQQ